MANKYKLKAEYSNEEIDLNFYKASAFVVNDRSYERNVQLLSNGNYNFVENGLEPVARDFSGAIVFKTDSVKTARQRFEEFKKFFGKNTYRDYIDMTPYAFDSETLVYAYVEPNPPQTMYVDMPIATHNVVRKTKLVSIHPNGEERFCYVFLKSLQNVKYTTNNIAVSVTFGMLTAWMKLYEFELEGSTFRTYQEVPITDFGDMDEVVVGAEFQPNNYRADDTFTLTGKTSLKIDFSKSVNNPNWIYTVMPNSYYYKGARVFIGEKVNQYLVAFARGNTLQRLRDGVYENRVNMFLENGYKYLDPSKSTRVTADYLNPTIRFESSRDMQNAGSQYSSYTGINGKIFYYAKFIED